MSITLEVAAPPIKYNGGKRQLLPAILPRIPVQIETYYEAFAGGAAVFFALANAGRFRRAVLGDSNADLVNMFIQLRDKCQAVIDHLRMHAQKNCSDYYYEQRARTLTPGPAGAARFIYLNRAGFNGLQRVNKLGQNNVPYGDNKNTNIANAARLRAVARSLQGVKIKHMDFEHLVRKAGVGDVVYFDPPYLPASSSANFTAYDSRGFGVEEHERLAACTVQLVKRGANVLLSNADTAEARRIYTRGGWHIESVMARRSINSDADKRGAVGELLISAPKRRKTVVT